MNNRISQQLKPISFCIVKDIIQNTALKAKLQIMLAIFVSEFKKTQQCNIFRNSLYAKFCSVSLHSHIQNLQGIFMSEFPEIVSIVLSFITNRNSFFHPFFFRTLRKLNQTSNTKKEKRAELQFAYNDNRFFKLK